MNVLIPYDDAMRLLQNDRNAKGRSPDDSHFVRWKSRTLTDLATIFGDDSRAVTDFVAINFTEADSDTSDQNKAFDRGCEAAAEHLGQLLVRLDILARAEADREQKQRQKTTADAAQLLLRQQEEQAKAEERRQRIFLSHKGADKPIVNRFFETLKAIGFDPWLDEMDMPAGTELDRAILHGFQESCAAVFFITPNFRDERYLRTEINHAVREFQARPERFRIITLVFTDDNGNSGTVPDMLSNYVYKAPKGELEGLREIIRSIPLRLGVNGWK